MAVHLKSWKPDICGCIIHLEFDDEDVSLPDKFFAMEKICPDHSHLFQQNILLASSTKKKKQKDKVLSALDSNYNRNKNSIESREEHGGPRLMGDGRMVFVAARPKHIVEKEKENLIAGLEKHTREVNETYDSILSTDFCLSENIYDIVKKETDDKNDVIKEIIFNPETPESVFNHNGNGDRTSLKDDTYTYEFHGTSPNRTINIKLHDNIKYLKKKYQDNIDKKLGKNKVVFS